MKKTDFILMMCNKVISLSLCFALCLGLVVNQELHAETGVGIDPTKPPVEVLENTLGENISHGGNVVLNGIKQDGKASFAILNDTFVRVGEVYKGYRLLAVRQGQVVLEDEDKQKVTLSMNVVDFKKSTAVASPAAKPKKRQSSATRLQHH